MILRKHVFYFYMVLLENLTRPSERRQFFHTPFHIISEYISLSCASQAMIFPHL